MAEVLPPLASAADLEALGIDTSDMSRVDSLLVSVSAEVREAAGVPISRTTSTVTVGGTCDVFLDLPGRPVRAVSSVEVDGSSVDDWRLVDGRLWRRCGWAGTHAPVTVTYDHGFDEVPADIVRLVCMFVAAGLHAAEDGYGSRRGMAYERIDDYQAGYMQGEHEVVDPAGIPERTRRMLRERFGAGAFVTRGF